MSVNNQKQGSSYLKFLSQASFDFARQFFSLIPIFTLFLVSKNELYLSVSVLTSSTIMTSALVVLGLNFVVIQRSRLKHIDSIMGYVLSVTPVAIIMAFGIFIFADKTGSIGFLALWLFIAAETIFCLPQLMLSRYSMAEFRIVPLIISNVLSPFVRAIALLTLTIPGYQVAASAIYLVSQIAITYALLKLLKTGVDFQFLRSKSFLRIVRDGIPNWLSGFGVSALDNLAVLLIAFFLNAELAASLILALRVFGVASLPMHSIASVKISAGLKSMKTEIQITLLTGLSSSLLGCAALALLDFLFFGRTFELLSQSGFLIFLPFLRTCTTFIGNYFTLIEKPWVRVWSGIAGVLALALAFSLHTNHVLGDHDSLVIGSIAVVFAETVMVGVLSLKMLLLRNSSKYLT
jgi:O-antigen/teichoic acid export membrane protein